ncbi:TIGR04282 family arsenosugar biosynthesis glycosyltransferase [Conexibacter sp. DBS9H8]|uniref:TIGR04282 family arsenosugar biosynthesis glycosyltransferase n=1 Tax=Conexibacter sp. DBS9H8 TaxID=2937801 RepID=UPI00200E932B|nr:TIGR04282 family arsenosugar biosynthesis glycosyltransferase [Conexibacter sp. DBS9H8]
MSPTLIVLAKEPLPGQVKTRLCPPCRPEDAARLAGAALTDTLTTVRATSATDRVLVFAGDPHPWLVPGVRSLPQRGGGLGERLQAAFDDVGSPALLIGMDTPQVTRAQLDRALAALAQADAVIGPTEDGGYWCIGLARPAPGAFAGVPMSTATTCARQLDRLAALGLTVSIQDRLRDVDTFADAETVAAETPGSRFGACFDAVLGALMTGPSR